MIAQARFGFLDTAGDEETLKAGHFPVGPSLFLSEYSEDSEYIPTTPNTHLAPGEPGHLDLGLTG